MAKYSNREEEKREKEVYSMKLGEKIKDIRTAKHLSLAELAKGTKLTSSFISQVERGIVSPSVNSLRKLAHALDINVGKFFEDELKDFAFIRRNKAPKIVDKETKSSCQILISDIMDIDMSPLILRLQKGGKIRKEFLHAKGDIFMMVIEGNIALYCNKEKFILNKQDSFYCKGQKRFDRIINAGNKEAVLLWIKSK